MSLRGKGRATCCLVAFAGVLAAGCTVGAVSAHGAFEITAFDGAVSDSGGGAYTQAGGHPNSASTTFQLLRTPTPNGPKTDGGDIKNARVDLPAGFVGNPAAVPQCPKRMKIPNQVQGLAGYDPNHFCPLQSIIGIADITVTHFGQPKRFITPVYNLEPPPGMPAQFGFAIVDQTAILDTMVRSDGDYGITVISRNINEVEIVLGVSVTVWGAPADHSHDDQRCVTFVNFANGNVWDEGDPLPTCIMDPFFKISSPWLTPNPAGLPVTGFLTNPTACAPAGTGLETRLRVEAWNSGGGSAPGPSDSASFISHLPPGFPLPPDNWGAPQGPTGCDKLSFDPSFAVEAQSRKADSPTGLTVDLSFPRDGLLNPTGLAPAQLKRATVTLPEGWTVSPSAADGLVGCSDAQSGVGTLLGAQCPPASKVGTVHASTALLDETLEGGVYVGTQESDDPLSGQMYRMFIALNNEERGIRVKLPGQIRIDPDTGRIEATFDNNPQVPVDRISLDLETGPRAPLATPMDCGTKSVVAELESWSGKTVMRSSGLTVNCPGVQGFSPGFEAGSAGVMAGRFSPFVVRIDRPDGQEFVDGVDVELPKGLLAKLAGVPLCPDVRADAGTCDAGSRIGSATVGAGPGSNPFYLSNQPVYLAGPYKGAPYSLSVVVHAKAGPFDLGLVVVRQALHVDRTDAHVTVKSDSVPTIVKGVPVRLRTVHVSVDRPGFTLNPTSCSGKDVKAVLHSQQGSTAAVTSRFGVHDCSLLAFKPKLKLALTGRKQTRTGKHPGVRAQVNQTGIGEAGIAKAKVTLPKSLALDPDNAQALCEYIDGTKPDLENHCPKGSIVGRARAVTPLLGEPLAGNVYFVKNVRRSRSGNLIRTLPMIVVALRGKIAINLKGESSTTRGGLLVNTFANVPDAPITRFNLNIAGGKTGILTVTRTRRSRINLCAAPKSHIADVEMDGQNAKRADFRTRVKTPCAKKAAKRSTSRKTAR